MTLWPYVPMPEIAEQLSWLTAVSQTYSDEMRTANRAGRQIVTFGHAMSSGYPQLEATFRANALGEWDVPMWHESARVGPVLATDTELAANLNADFRDRAYICDGSASAIVEIESIGATLVLTAPVGQSFTNPLVMPLHTAIAPAGLQVSKMSRSQYRATVEFTLTQDFAAEDEVFPQYLDLDYLACALIALQPLNGQILQQALLVDNQTGPIMIEAQRGIRDAITSITLIADTATVRWQLKRWLGRLRGRDRPFWIPSWAGALQLVGTALSGATSITVAPLYGLTGDYVGQHIYLGGTQFRQITAAVPSGGNHVLSVAALSADATAAPRLIRKVRMEADMMQFTHRRNFVSRLNFAVQEVPG